MLFDWERIEKSMALKGKKVKFYNLLISGEPKTIEKKDSYHGMILEEIEMRGPSLRDVIAIKKQKNEFFSRYELRQIFSDLLEDLYDLHMNGFAHLAIFPKNII